MGIHTDAYEIDEPSRYEELGRRMDNRGMDNRGGIYNGSTKLITSLLALMNLLTAAAIVGGVVMYGRVTSLDEKVNLIIQGRIQIATGTPHNGP